MDTRAFIFDILNKELYAIHEEMLQKISSKYNIDIDELKNDFLKPLSVIPEHVEKVVICKKQQKRVIPDKEHRCNARVWKGGQCTRACKEGSIFCSQHISIQKHGIIKQL